jgi:tetratricopeptide (TPR) repeat protein
MRNGDIVKRSLRMAVCLLFLSRLVQAQETPSLSPDLTYDLWMTKGTALLNGAQFLDADEAFQAALTARADDPRATYLLGIAQGKREKYAEAERTLRRALKMSLKRDEREGAYHDLGVVLFKQGKYDEALESLKYAREIAPENPLISFNEGMVYKKMGQDDAAVAAFQKAAAGAQGLPWASSVHYQMGVVLYRQQRHEEAWAAFSEVIHRSPESDIAKSSGVFLEKIEEAERTVLAGGKKPWELSVHASTQHDSNVTLDPTISPSSDRVSRRRDNRFVLQLGGSREFAASVPWGAGYSFYRSWHSELSPYDVQSHEPYLYWRFQKERLDGRLEYLYNFVIVGDERYMQSHTLRPTVTLIRSSTRSLQFVYQLQYRSFKDSAPIFLDNSERDGINNLFGLTENFAFAHGKRGLRLGYTVDADRTQTDDWEAIGHRIFIAGEALLPLALKLEGGADYSGRRYSNPNSFSASTPKEERDDVSYTANIGLSHTLNAFIEIATQYTYIRNDSNIPIFDYTRGVYALNITGRF